MKDATAQHTQQEFKKLMQIQDSIEKAYTLIESLRKASSLIKKGCPAAARLDIQHRRNRGNDDVF